MRTRTRRENQLGDDPKGLAMLLKYLHEDQTDHSLGSKTCTVSHINIVT